MATILKDLIHVKDLICEINHNPLGENKYEESKASLNEAFNDLAVLFTTTENDVNIKIKIILLSIKKHFTMETVNPYDLFLKNADELTAKLNKFSKKST